MDDKIIVTHHGALTVKYKAAGFTKVRAALHALVAADETRGVKTGVVYLDDAKAMKKLRAKPLGNVKDARAAKAAIDAVFKALEPDYLMILGAPDVVPHQDLDNPAFAAGDDDDRKAFGDLPYACESPYGRDPARFVGPTRVVTRLPDLTGATEPSHLIALLKTAAGWRRRKASEYSKYFGLSASVWKGSTRLSLDNIFGNATKLLLAPPKGPRYPEGELGARMHFINCHGGRAAPEFYGQAGNTYPTSLTARTTMGAIRNGTVASVECCYGGELYDSVTLGLDVPICQSYLRQGAYGYLGSTTIAYGPADDNGVADLLCQFFLANILAGASLGRAALMARQQFVERAAQMDPVDLKTLAQFCAYGDPSVHPVFAPRAADPPNGAEREAVLRFQRGERRQKLRQTGEFLQRSKPTASQHQKGARASLKARSELASIAVQGGLTRRQEFAAFKVKGGGGGGGAKAMAAAPSRYYLAIGLPNVMARVHAYRVAVVAKEAGGRIIDYRIYRQR